MSPVSRLCEAINVYRQALETPRCERFEAVRQYAGDHWSEETAGEKIHINLLSLYVDIVLRNLIAKTPRVMLSTLKMQEKPVVAAMQDWANTHFEKMRLASSLQRIALDALFSVGIAKVGLIDPARSAAANWRLAPGEASVQRVDLDDFVFDMNARDFAEASFIGHRYRVPLEVAKDFYKKTGKELTASEGRSYNTQGDERIDVLGRGYYGADEYIEMVDLWEIWCPQYGVIHTLSEDSLTGATSLSNGTEPKALAEEDWIGHDSGPYKFLGLMTVPGNAMPKGPIQNLINMHRSANRVLSKLIWSAENFKDVTILPKGAEADWERIKTAMHGGVGFMDRADQAKQIAMNRPDPMLLQFFIQLKEIFSWMAGNLDIMGGLSPQSKTARQDTMLNENSTRGIADMQDRMVTFASEVTESLLWYAWHDPKLIMNAPYSPQGLPDIQIPRALGPWNAENPRMMKRTGAFEDMQIKIDPYSLPHSTPQKRAQDLIQVVTKLYFPYAQIAMQQGITLDFNTFLEKLGVYLDMPDLKEIMKMAQPLQSPETIDMGQSPAEDTTHTRENVPMRTNRGDSMNAMNALAGIDTGGASQPEPSMNGAY